MASSPLRSASRRRGTSRGSDLESADARTLASRDEHEHVPQCTALDEELRFSHWRLLDELLDRGHAGAEPARDDIAKLRVGPFGRDSEQHDFRRVFAERGHGPRERSPQHRFLTM